MSSELFAGLPGINIPRSKWKTHYNVTGSMKHGKLVPIDAIPVLPGDSIEVAFKDLTRMQTPLAPIFGNIKQSFFAFFVPMRLVWEHTEEFFGANKTSAGYQTTTYTLPLAKFERCEVGSPSNYLGKPLKAYSDTDANGNSYFLANILKERAYYLIWNEYFRAQQITNPVLINLTDSTKSAYSYQKVGTWNGSAIRHDKADGLMSVSKMFDYFTAATISPQYGSAVALPFVQKSVPIIGASTEHDPGEYGIVFRNNSISDNPGMWAPLGIDTGVDGSDRRLYAGPEESGPTTTIINRTNLIADLSNATMTYINDIRYAFAVQKYLERANFSGNYFFGILNVHYGVTSPDSRLQRPEFLGEITEDILVHQVVATADTVNSGVKTSVGGTGAMSVTASGLQHICSKGFVEPGYLVLLRCCRHRQVYSQGVMREDFKSDRFELYTPELCNLGDQATLTRELYWKAGESEIFGYQEHWAEYRYRPDRVCGILDPTTGSSGLGFWTLANRFTSKPELNDDFIFENRTSLDDALVTGSAYDEYIFDTYVELTLTREMPVRTMPGLIDHFGAM